MVLLTSTSSWTSKLPSCTVSRYPLGVSGRSYSAGRQGYCNDLLPECGDTNWPSVWLWPHCLDSDLVIMPGSTGKYLFTHVNYPQSDSAEVTPDTVGILPTSLSRVAFFYSHKGSASLSQLKKNPRKNLFFLSVVGKLAWPVDPS